MNDNGSLEGKINQILKIVDKDPKRQWIETICTVLLSAATVLSAWRVYQSSQWSGEQYFRIDDETAANQFRLQYEVEGAQRKTAELQLFLDHRNALVDGNIQLADFLYERFPSSLKTAYGAWYKMDHTNPDNISSPFQIKEYVIPELVEAKKYKEKAAGFKKATNIADNNSDNYVLVSLVLSMVLFFSGICGVINSYLNQGILVGIAVLIFLTAGFFLLRMPVILV
jgi:hypothetical protein